MKSKLLLSVLLTSALGLLSLMTHAETEGKVKGKVVTSGDKGMLMPEGGSGTIIAKTNKQGAVPAKPPATK